MDLNQNSTPGFKFNEYEIMGVPIRIEVGPKDIQKNEYKMVRRFDGKKTFIHFDKLKDEVAGQIQTIHDLMYERAE